MQLLSSGPLSKPSTKHVTDTCHLWQADLAGQTTMLVTMTAGKQHTLPAT